jgi:hypothetical protein
MHSIGSFGYMGSPGLQLNRKLYVSAGGIPGNSFRKTSGYSHTTGILSTCDSIRAKAQERVQPWLGKYNVISPQKGECISMALAATSIKA